MQPITVSLETAKKIITAAEQKAQEIGVPMVISVADSGGNLVAVHRMDEALLASIDISINKAFTAVAVKLPTHQLTEVAQPGSSLFGIHTTNQGKIVIFGGGLPLMADGKVLGGIGVSGGTVEQDLSVAEAGRTAFTQQK